MCIHPHPPKPMPGATGSGKSSDTAQRRKHAEVDDQVFVPAPGSPTTGASAPATAMEHAILLQRKGDLQAASALYIKLLRVSARNNSWCWDACYCYYDRGSTTVFRDFPLEGPYISPKKCQVSRTTEILINSVIRCTNLPRAWV